MPYLDEIDPNKPPEWLRSVLGIKEELTRVHSVCRMDTFVFVNETTNRLLLSPLRCMERTCLPCQNYLAVKRTLRILPSVAKLPSPTHLTLTVPCSACGRGDLGDWITKLSKARSLFLRKGNSHRGLGSSPVPDWRLWKLEVTYNPHHKWWHPHYHVLLSDWLRYPLPKIFNRTNKKQSYSLIASYIRLRWADCLRSVKLPVPTYDHKWSLGDESPPSLSNVANLNRWKTTPTNLKAACKEISKYVSKPDFLAAADTCLLREYDSAFSNGKSSLRVWQLARGFAPKEKSSDQFTFFGSLNQMKRKAYRDPYSYSLGEAVSSDLLQLIRYKSNSERWKEFLNAPSTYTNHSEVRWREPGEDD